MNDYFHAFILAVLQGLTEFLPVSSSAHLILLPKFMGWQDQGLAFDIAVHVGTLIAIICYFYKELKIMTQHWLQSCIKRQFTIHSKLAWFLLLATIPIGLAGLILQNIIETNFRSFNIIAITTLVFGVLLGISNWYNNIIIDKINKTKVCLLDAMLIGSAQVLALIPGTSRSGITLTAGLMLGLNKQIAAKFSFLLAIPVIALAGILKSIKLLHQPNYLYHLDWSILLFGCAISACIGHACISIFLRLLDKYGVLPFVIYRVLLALILFAFL